MRRVKGNAPEHSLSPIKTGMEQVRIRQGRQKQSYKKGYDKASKSQNVALEV